MSVDRATSQSDTVWPPTAGSVVVLPVSTSIVVVDLTGCPGSTVDQTSGPDQSGASGAAKNPLGRYVTFEADGGDVYVVLASSLAIANSVSVTTGASVTNNALVTTNVATGMWKIANGSQVSWLLPPGQYAQMSPPGSYSQCRYLAYATLSGTSSLRFYQSSQ